MNAEKIARENSLCRAGALRMPLHAHDKMIRAVELNGFDNSIVWRDCSDTQIISRGSNCLMMARIHLRIGFAGEREDFR